MAISSTRVGLGVCQEQLPTYRLPKHTTQKAMSLKLTGAMTTHISFTVEMMCDEKINIVKI